MSRVTDLVANAGEREGLIEAVAELVEKEISAERQRCAEFCRGRAELWRRTPAASAPMPAARDEARARANEAAFLADALETLPLRHDDGEATN